MRSLLAQMPPTLVSNFHANAIPLRPFLQMPNVVVVPPEEDDIPSWCCFDANEVPSIESLLANSPDFGVTPQEARSQPPVFYHDVSQPPTSHNTAIFPETVSGSRFSAGVLLEDEYPQSKDETRLDASEESTSGDSTSPGNDSEIVEVVKVRRCANRIEGRSHSPPPSKTRRSLRHRASRALRSLRTLGKRPSPLEPPVPDMPTPYIMTEAEYSPTSSKATVTHRSSTIFSQFFPSRSIVHSRPSLCSLTATQDEFQSRSTSHLTLRRYPSSVHRKSSSPITLDGQSIRAPSPTSMIQDQSSRQRASRSDVHRFFSFSSVNKTSQVTITPPSVTLTSPVDPMQVPTFQNHKPRYTEHGRSRVAELNEGDASFEMKLESLYFEALSFDVDKF